MMVRYVLAYTIVYAVFLVAGWYSPHVPAVVVFGLSHMFGLVGAIGTWLIGKAARC